MCGVFVPDNECPECWEGTILSRSAWLIFIFGGAYAAPTVNAEVVLSFIVINSMLYEVSCGTSSTGMSLWVAMSIPLLSLLAVVRGPSFRCML